MIEITKLNKTYQMGKPNAFQALYDIDLTIEAGEMTAILGKSGAGKSTLLHILGNQERFESGSYRFLGKEVGKLSDRELSKLRAKDIGFVLQDFGLIMEESVVNNVSVPLFFDKTRIRDIKPKVLKALERVGITELMGKKVRYLSGGQKQRVAIARAIVNNPSLLLADEPTGALDTATSEEIMKVMEGLNKAGTTVVIVTHEKNIADCCRRQVVLSDGRITGTEAAAQTA